RRALTHLALPFGTDLRKVVHPYEGRTRAVGTMNDGDFQVRQLDARIELGNCRIVPFADLAEVDVGKHGPRELELTGLYAFEIDYRHIAADDCRKLQQPVLVELLRFERHIGCTEVDSPVLNLLDASARAYRLVLHAD